MTTEVVMSKRFFLKGTICHTPSLGGMVIAEDSYLLCKDGRCGGIYSDIPDQYDGYPVEDTGGCLIIPGLVDLHIHAPQFAYRGLGMDCELLQWLYRYAYPEETKYADISYADKAYRLFAKALAATATTRAVVFATVHSNATLHLMDIMEKTGMVSYIGKINMDRDAPEGLREVDADSAAQDTLNFVNEALDRGYRNTYPIITPRFIPSCTDALLQKISDIRARFDLPVQSHLSENPEEVELVRSLMPDASSYGDAYNRFGLFGGDARTVMAHCIYSTDEEINLMKENGVWVAHCPDCNMNVASGIAPIRRYLENGMNVGLGTDVAGGHTESMFRAITAAVQVSKLHWRLLDHDSEPLSFQESFYMATKGGGSFFGRVGSFEDDYEFDAVVLDDSVIPHPQPLTAHERIERAFYLGLDRNGIRSKYVRGKRVRT